VTGKQVSSLDDFWDRGCDQVCLGHGLRIFSWLSVAATRIAYLRHCAAMDLLSPGTRVHPGAFRVQYHAPETKSPS